MKRNTWLSALAISLLALMFLAAPARATAPAGNTADGTDALCGTYVEIYDPATGQRISTRTPGNTMTVNAFSQLHIRTILDPGTRVLLMFRWAGGGFDYLLALGDGSCTLRDEPGLLPGSAFPVGTQTNVSVCFTSWELGQVICGPMGFIFRTF